MEGTSALPSHLSPMVGPRGIVGRLIAGETVSKAEQLADQSPMIRVFIDRDVQLGQLEAIGFIVQCAVCAQRAVLHLQPAGEWTCPRCTLDPALDPVRDWCCSTPLSGPHAHGCLFEPRPNIPIEYGGPAVFVDQIESVRISRHQGGTAREFIDAEVRKSAAAAGFGDIDVDQAEPDWPIGEVCL